MNFEIPDLVSNTFFFSRALPNVVNDSEAPQREEASQDNLIFDGPFVTFCDHGFECVRYFTGQPQLVIAPFLL